jgi:hypothetical protein
VAAIGGGQPADRHAFGQRDERGIDETQIQ